MFCPHHYSGVADRPGASYDALPYPSTPKVWSHPDRLATVARLYGLNPPPVERCRVLELGCSDGGNLLPMAVALPHCEFVGVDYAPVQIAAGRAAVEALGLGNISLVASDVRALGDDLGRFDYIIAYGIYSWVPPDAQDHILRLCARLLAPTGVAFISYNTYPGWHVRVMVREMLRYHVAQAGQEGEDVRAQVARAREFLDFLTDSAAALRTRFGDTLHAGISESILQGERDFLRAQPDTYLAHELLEDANAPVYFHEFVARAERHHLQYLAEAEAATMQFGNLPQPVADGLERISRTRVEAEQYRDFLVNRTFRQTLLCHADALVEPTPTAIAELALASPTVPDSSQPDLADGVGERFRGPTGTVLRISSPLTKAALLELHERWPRAVPFRETLRLARLRLGESAIPSRANTDSLDGVDGEDGLDDPDALALAQHLLRCFGVDLVELHSHVAPFTVGVAERPIACPLARYQARHGAVVVNRRHEAVSLGDTTSRAVLELLDGTRDRAALLTALQRRVAAGDLPSTDPAAASPPDSAAPTDLASALDDALRLLARSALLVG